MKKTSDQGRDWRDDYPKAWRDVGRFFVERLKSGQPPFEGFCHVVHVGRGRWGEVYLCNQGREGPFRAVKIVRSDFETEKEEESRRQWERESEQARKLSMISTALVAGLADKVETEAPGFLIFEGVSGRTLENRLEAPDPPSIPLIVHWVCQIAKALNIVWRHGIEWTDLHSGNIFLRDDNSIVLIDPGPCFPGAYTPPEWRTGGHVLEPSGNVYSLGLLFLSMFVLPEDRETVERISEGESMDEFPEGELMDDRIFRVVFRRLEREKKPMMCPNKLAGRLTRLLVHALEPQPDHRIQHPVEFAGELKKILAK